jgi:hypothetical protein
MICVQQEKEDNVEAILNVEDSEHEDSDHHWKCLKRTKKVFIPCRPVFFTESLIHQSCQTMLMNWFDPFFVLQFMLLGIY